jgi:hypothetical protein
MGPDLEHVLMRSSLLLPCCETADLESDTCIPRGIAFVASDVAHAVTTISTAQTSGIVDVWDYL